MHTKKIDFQCCSFFEDGMKLKIFSEIYLSLTAMNWLYGRMNRFHLPWTKVQPKFERKCRPSIIILVWSNTYSALECKFNSILFKTVFKLFVTFFSSSKAFVFVKKNFVTSELQTKCQKNGNFLQRTLMFLNLYSIFLIPYCCLIFILVLKTHKQELIDCSIFNCNNWWQSHQYLTNVLPVLLDWLCNSQPNCTLYGTVYITEFIQNSIILNMGMIFLTSDLMKAVRGQKHLSEAKKGMKELI